MLAPPPFDQELALPLRNILIDLPPMTFDEIPRRRKLSLEARLSDAEITRGGRFQLAEFWITVPAGGPEMRAIVCRPTLKEGPRPVIYSIHGGGMVAGDFRSPELSGELDRAQAVDLAVVSVEYRLAPEHPDPAPLEDCYAGMCWVAEAGVDIGVDPRKIILSGNSAGGGLAAGVALLARDRGGPGVIGQMLQCPMLDDRCDSPSAWQMDGIGLWDRTSNLTAWSALLGDRRGTADVSIYAAPARATDLSALPPAFIDVGSAEALRDEAIAYAAGICRAGGDAELHVWAGAFHSFDQWVPSAKVSKAATGARISWLRRLLGRR